MPISISVLVTTGLGLEPNVLEECRSWSRKNYQVLVSKQDGLDYNTGMNKPNCLFHFLLIFGKVKLKFNNIYTEFAWYVKHRSVKFLINVKVQSNCYVMFLP